MLLDKFHQDGEPYPDPDARLRQVHTVQVKFSLILIIVFRSTRTSDAHNAKLVGLYTCSFTSSSTEAITRLRI